MRRLVWAMLLVLGLATLSAMIDYALTPSGWTPTSSASERGPRR
jgi:hypothetical protein